MQNPERSTRNKCNRIKYKNEIGKNLSFVNERFWSNVTIKYKIFGHHLNFFQLIIPQHDTQTTVNVIFFYLLTGVNGGVQLSRYQLSILRLPSKRGYLQIDSNTKNRFQSREVPTTPCKGYRLHSQDQQKTCTKNK